MCRLCRFAPLALLLLPLLLVACPTAPPADDDESGDDDDVGDDDTGDDDTGDDDTGDDDTGDDDTGDDDTGDDDTGEYDLAPGTYEDTFGGRSYVFHLPAGYDPSDAIPLVIGFHGAGDSASNFFATMAYTGWIDAAAPDTFALLVPDTLSPYGDFAIWSGNPNNDMDEMVDELDSVLDLVHELANHAHLDLDRVHGLGFSDGGLFVGVAGITLADELATLSITGYGWGGFYPHGNPARLIPVLFVCGTADNFYTYAQQSESFLSGMGHPTRFDGINGVGHQFTGIMAATTPDEVWDWIGGFQAP